MKALLVSLAGLCLWVLSPGLLHAAEAPEILLWPGGAPGSEGRTEAEKSVTAASGECTVSAVHKPSITPFLPEAGKATGAAVLVIPGGGHSKLCMSHEGYFVARWLADHGVAAFVLKHRLAREPGSTYTIKDHAVPDAERAMRLIRSRAVEWGVDPARLGAIGFSAGGELVAQASMHTGEGKPDATDPVERQSSRPSFQGLIYPGRSGDIQPDNTAPPAFLACGEKDREDIGAGLAEVYLRFRKAGGSAELHVYAGVGHGFGYRPGMKGPVAGWLDRFQEWMNALPKPGSAPAKP